MARLSGEKISLDIIVEAARDEIASLKNAVNQQKLDNAELHSIISTQRYTQHPGNVVTPAAMSSETDVAADSHRQGIYRHSLPLLIAKVKFFLGCS